MEQNKIGFEASWRELLENLRYKGGENLKEKGRFGLSCANVSCYIT